MKIAILHNLRAAEVPSGAPDDWFEEYDTPETIADISRVLGALGHETEGVIADRKLPQRLERGQFDFAFNIAEGAGQRRCREAIPAAVCELLGIPFTGSDALTLAITLDKAMARRIVRPEVPVAAGALIQSREDEQLLQSLRYPVLVKPNDEGSSKGIRDNPIADDPESAAARCRHLNRQYGCPVLVEKILSGAEITVGIAGNGAGTHILGAMEIAPSVPTSRFVYSLEMKRNWRQAIQYHVPPRIPPGTFEELKRLALVAYRILGCRDIARMDFRLDASGSPHFIECNALPGLNSVYGDLVISARNDFSYDQIIAGILHDAAARQGIVMR